jgi:TRAP-type C4-dicarboxylate transport system permease small subunit
MYRLGRLLAWITNMTTIAGALAIAFMMLHISADVLARFLFDTPLPGTITIVSNYYMIIAAFIPLAFAEQKEAHISVEVVTELLPGVVQKHLAGWLLLVSMAAFALLAVRTWGEALAKHRIGASIVQGDTSILIWPTYYMLPIGCGLMVLILGYKFLVYLTGKDSGLDRLRAQADQLPDDD